MRTQTSRSITLAFLLASLPTVATSAPDHTPGSLVVRRADPAAVTVRTPEEELWYGRLIAGMDASDALVESYMSGGDSYTVGRGGGDYTEALVMALRATGEQRFLDRLLELTEIARGSLRDAWVDGTTDGYLGWNWLIDPANATYYGKDTNWLDESISSGNAALWAWAFHVNRDLDPRYAAAADFWRGYLENHFLAKWYARVGGNPIVAWNTPFAAFYKPDTEPRSANWRLAHYLWRITGNTFYRDREEEIVTELIRANTINPAHPTAYRWPRQTDPASQDWQAINYCNYYMRVALEMNLEGVRFYSSPIEMERFAATFRDVVYANTLPNRTSMTANCNGDGSTGFALYAFNGFATWDTTGFLMDLANRSIVGAGNYAGGGLSGAARNDMSIAAYALLALSPDGTTSTFVSRFIASPLQGGAVRIEWELNTESGNLQTNVYRVADDGVGHTQVNGTPLLGPGPHVLVDDAPGRAAVLTYELAAIEPGGERTLERIVVQRGPQAGPGLRLEPVAPNPFATTTTLAFELPRADRVRLVVHDASGRLVRTLEDAELAAGRHTRAWDGRDEAGHRVPGGLYFLSAETTGERRVQRAVRMP